nr:penicillin-binding protein 1A [Spirulina major]
MTKAAGGTILGITMLSSSLVAGGLVGLAISFRNLPDVRVLRNFVPTETSYIYDIKGKILDSLHGEYNREVVKLDEISPNLKRAVLAIEDSHFYLHDGINPNSIGRALLVNWRRGSVVEGGSTVTMQLVKNLFLSRQRTFSRKLAEAVLAIRVEQIFTKDQVLEMYLNNIYWGHNSYGAETAAQSYFGKSAKDLNLAESAVMAGLIQAPEDYSPFIDYKKTKQRQYLVLQRMQDLGWITAKESEEAKKAQLLIGQPTAWKSSELPYITEAVVAELQKRFGEDALLKGGMRVQTTVDYNFQKMAEENVAQAHQNLKNRGLYADQVALVAIDPRTHYVKAMVGGVNYKESQFNRAIQSLRQPGSSFKPFVYYTAFASGKYTPYSSINDSPVRYRDGSAYYEPQNYGGSFSGSVSLRTAIIQSLNVPAVKIGQAVGIDNVIEVCRTLGISSPLDPVISLPLGSIGITPMEIAGAYATFASNGWHSKPTVIARVTDSSGNVLLDNTPKPRLVLDPWATASLTSVLKGVLEGGGTAPGAAIGRPAAGKTGTTTSERDVWFVGYVPQLSVAVWIGNDNYRPLGKGVTGGGYAAPIWRGFMREALKNEPVKHFPSPSKFPRPKA